MIALLQAGNYAEPHAARYDAATMGMFVLIIAIGVIGFIVQARLQSVFKKYSKVQFPTQNALLCWIGVGMIAMSALFSLVTLPVEYNASARAVEWLQTSRTMQGAQLAQAKEALSWAARTYLVAALSAIASVLYYVFLILGRRD